MASVTAAASKTSPRVIFSGIQPTGVPHLGNYAGALKQWASLQRTEPATTKLIYSVVDLHALTSPRPPSELRRARRETLAALLAVGIDHKRATVFYQSSVPEHSELMWILSCSASVGYLSRMTQWKQKMKVEDDFDLGKDSPTRQQLRLGLLSYPVLQAADILIHRATHVPVGHDQAQHLEFARECATQFNKTYSKCLVEPQTLIPSVHRIKSLLDPTSKMSKSDPKENSRILITDSPDTIRTKVRKARTDSSNDSISYDPDQRPGVSNLLDMLSIFDPDQRSPIQLADSYRNSSLQQLKEAVGDSLVAGLDGVRDRYLRLIEQEQDYLEQVEVAGTRKARESAARTMNLVRNATGIPAVRS